MECKFNIQDKKAIKRLMYSNRFRKYPDIFLNTTSNVRVNNDEGLIADEFIIKSKYRILPRKIYIYGKKTFCREDENNLYLNYWLSVFLNTVEFGNLCKTDFVKSDSKMELTIGLPLKYRLDAFSYRRWTRKDIISFLSCLFNNDIDEANYEQQDLFEDILVA